MRTVREEFDRRLRNAWISVVVVALFPRIAKRKPGYDSPKRVLRRVAISTAMQFVLRQWVAPRMRELGEEREREQQALTHQLGRAPTEEELIEHLMRRRRADG
jgi:hypothetical protein